MCVCVCVCVREREREREREIDCSSIRHRNCVTDEALGEDRGMLALAARTTDNTLRPLVCHVVRVYSPSA